MSSSKRRLSPSERAELARDREFNEFMELKKLHPDWSTTVIQLHQQKVKAEKYQKARMAKEAREKRKDAELSVRLQREEEAEELRLEENKKRFLLLNQNDRLDEIMSTVLHIPTDQMLLEEYENLETEVENNEFGAAISDEQHLEEMLLLSRFRARRKLYYQAEEDSKSEIPSPETKKRKTEM